MGATNQLVANKFIYKVVKLMYWDVKRNFLEPRVWLIRPDSFIDTTKLVTRKYLTTLLEGHVIIFLRGHTHTQSQKVISVHCPIMIPESLLLTTLIVFRAIIYDTISVFQTNSLHPKAH